MTTPHPGRGAHRLVNIAPQADALGFPGVGGAWEVGKVISRIGPHRLVSAILHATALSFCYPDSREVLRKVIAELTEKYFPDLAGHVVTGVVT